MNDENKCRVKLNGEKLEGYGLLQSISHEVLGTELSFYLPLEVYRAISKRMVQGSGKKVVLELTFPKKKGN